MQSSKRLLHNWKNEGEQPNQLDLMTSENDATEHFMILQGSHLVSQNDATEHFMILQSSHLASLEAAKALLTAFLHTVEMVNEDTKAQAAQLATLASST